MALPGLHRAELVLFAAAFLAGAVVAAAVFRTQVGRGPLDSCGVGVLSALGLRISLALSAAAIFLVLVSACILRFGTKSLCASILSSKIVTCCSEAQKLPWKPPVSGLHFYSILYDAEASAWVTLGLWCLVLALQLLQWKWEGPPYRPLERGDPEWSSETDALFGARSPDPSLKSLR
ncbi:transmembrane protein 179B isoform X3 [Gracilinanus agilis]|uniref:transmembrane protein 179B isoform X3 n=1 Tax=Gracilinanus agilis TaxID=191870 RepID=UPI001CFD7987|nr:transmembrane protein 179B isoform X3 [Gracilinanus agilis]